MHILERKIQHNDPESSFYGRAAGVVLAPEHSCAKHRNLCLT
jgi:hypothetical protein